MMDPENIPKLDGGRRIEVARWRSCAAHLNDSFIILDEAQNTTGEQMKMFRPGSGFGFKIVVTGDISQVDLRGVAAGWPATRILDGIDDIHFAQTHQRRRRRHRLVADIVDAHGRAESQLSGNRRAARHGPGRRS